MAEAPAIGHASEHGIEDTRSSLPARSDPALSFRAAWRVVVARRRVVLPVILGALLVCGIYCAVAPPQYESRARLALRTSPATSLRIEEAGEEFSGSLASGQTQLETLASVLRSDQLAWRVIVEKKLYGAPAFSGRFARRFPDFRPEQPAPDAQTYLLARFQDRLHVRTIPRTLLLEIDFRCGDAALSADVVDALIRAYQAQEEEARVEATGQAAGWLREQLVELRGKSERDNERLAGFQKQHGIVIAPETLSNGQSGAAQHLSALLEMDELSRTLAVASADRIVRESEYRAAAQGDPEQVLAADNRAGQDSGDLSMAVFRQIHARHAQLEEEQAQLNLEHGPNFPRVVEVREQIQDLDQQLQSADEKLRERYKRAWQISLDREQMLRRSLDQRTSEGLKANTAAMQYESMRREADASSELYLRVQGKAEEAGLAAGVPKPEFRVVDGPRVSAKAVSPNWILYMAVTLFVSSWLVIAVAFAMESIRPLATRAMVVLLGFAVASAVLRAQAPTPSTSGLPTGVARIPQSRDARVEPNPKDASSVGNVPGVVTPGAASLGVNLSGAIPAPIAPGDLLDVSEFHTPEFRTTVRVTAAGTVNLPLVGDVAVQGMDEPQAERAIAEVLSAKGMLRHPHVQVLVIASVGQDVSILGEVVRPGVYPYGVHHRLLDLLAAASGATPAAGTLAYIYP